MLTQSKFSSALTLLTMAFCLSVGCGKDPVGPQQQIQPSVEAAPSFIISSVQVTLADGSAGLQFAGKPSDDVNLVKVVIQNPLGGTTTFNLGGSVYIADGVFSLQPANTGYFKASGPWTFIFTGNKATGSKASFEVTATVNVGA